MGVIGMFCVNTKGMGVVVENVNTSGIIAYGNPPLFAVPSVVVTVKFRVPDETC
jgi:hypothetical protein